MFEIVPLAAVTVLIWAASAALAHDYKLVTGAKPIREAGGRGHRVKAKALLIVAISLFSEPTIANDFDTATEAYNNGNYKKAFSLFEASAKSGNVQASHNVGVLYHSGQGTKRDDVKAMAYYRRAADQGFAPSEHNVGQMYDDGDGVKADPVLSRLWMEKAAEHGSVDAQIHLGAAAFVNKRYTDAFRRYFAVAEQDNDGVLFNIAGFYYSGTGVKKEGEVDGFLPACREGWESSRAAYP